MVALGIVVHTLTGTLGEGVGLGNGGQQSLGIGMQGMLVQIVAVGHLHQLAEVHDADAVREVLDHGQVVGDEQDGQAHFLLQVVQQVDDLGLNGHVQSRHRLVRDDQLGLGDDGAGDADTLALAAGELMGIAGGVFLGKAHLPQHGNHAAADLLRVGDAADLQALAHDLLDGHTGVQGFDGVLEDHGDVIGEILAQVLVHLAGDVPAVEIHLAGGGVVQADDGTAGGGLAAAGFAHQAEGLSGADAEADVVHRVNGDLFLASAGSERLAEVLYFKNVVGIVIRISHC